MPIRSYRTSLLAIASAAVLPLPAIAAPDHPPTRKASRAPAGGHAHQLKRHARPSHGRVATGHRAAVRGPAEARRHAVRIHRAGDPGVTIADFQFSPGTTTIHTGDTITWTNNGPSDHTATANNGSFDTSTLHKGQSGSHTFTQAGIISYYCRIHPFMKGTVVVLAAAGSASAGAPGGATGGATGGSGASAGGSGAAAATTAAGAGGPTLPFTGLDVGAGLGVGMLLLGGGLGLRRALRGW